MDWLGAEAGVTTKGRLFSGIGACCGIATGAGAICVCRGEDRCFGVPSPSLQERAGEVLDGVQKSEENEDWKRVRNDDRFCVQKSERLEGQE